MKIREADLEEDRGALIAFIRENLNEQVDQRRYDWLYLENPHGRARVWLAVEEDDRTLVGVAAALPRRAWFDADEVPCWNLADFAIDPRHRSLGPALQLQRACMGVLDEGFCYDHPSRSMVAIYRRMGVKSESVETRFAKLIRADSVAKRRFGEGLAARAVAGLLGVGLRVRDRIRFLGTERSRIDSPAGRFEPEFDDFESSRKKRAGLEFVRSSAYLNWRYVDNPSPERYEVLVTRRDDAVSGYAVVHRAGDGLVIDELVWDREEVSWSLLRAMSRRARETGASTLQVQLTSSDGEAFLAKTGFLARESAPLLVFEKGPEGCVDLGAGRSLWLSGGDRLGG